MPRWYLPASARKYISSAVDKLFEKAKKRVFGPWSVDKRIVIGRPSDLTLPGIFAAASAEERNKPDEDILAPLLEIANGYIEATKLATKTKVIRAVDTFIRQAEASGVDTDVETVLQGELAEIWGKTTSDMRRIVDTEAQNASAMGIMDGIIKVNAASGIDDPVVYFVIVRDEHVCDECLRLHMLNGQPRLWYLSELKQGYHKKGEDFPSVSGCHPFCRCSKATLLPSYGFNSDGYVTYIAPGHNEIEIQRGTKKSELWYDDLEKMAIADIPAGQETGVGHDPMMGEMKEYDYSHVLSPQQRDQGYGVRVRHRTPNPFSHIFEAALTHVSRNNGNVGAVRAVATRSDAIEPHSEIHEGHRGKGLGTALYEALYRHAQLNGIKRVVGGYHSPDAARVHQALATKHGLKYEAKPGDPRDFEGRGSFQGYEYTIKDELSMEKAEEDFAPDVTTPEPSASISQMPKKPRAPKKVQRSLVGIHNLSHENLLHAHEIGGLVAPSLAITHKDHPLDDFGDISLVARHHLIDPEQVPVFDADVYSPRHPRAKYKVNQKELDKLKAELSEHSKAVDAYFGDAEDDIKKDGEHWGLINYKRRRALGRAFLASKGINFNTPIRKKPMRYGNWAEMPALQEFYSKNKDALAAARSGDFTESDIYRQYSEAAMQAAYQAGKKDAEDAGFDEEDAKDFAENTIKENFDSGRLFYGPGERLLRDLEHVGQEEPDTHALGELIDEELKNHPDFEPWAQAKTAPAVGERYLPKWVDHHMYGPSERKLPYTLDNVLKQMTRSLRAGEGFNYGLGNLRAQGAKKFRSIDQMLQHRHRIVPKEKFEEHKKANDDKFFELANRLGAGGFRGTDGLLEALSESFKRGRSLRSELAKSGFTNVSSDLLKELQAFKEDLVKMPTDYFEAKPQRVVHLNEFQGAAVPHDTPQNVLDALKAAGVTNIQLYNKKKPETRAKAIHRIAHKQNLLLSEKAPIDELAKSTPEGKKYYDALKGKINKNQHSQFRYLDDLDKIYEAQNGRVTVNFGTGIIPNLLGDGRFLNTFDTNTSEGGGFDDPENPDNDYHETRRQAENSLFSIPHEETGEVRPIYGAYAWTPKHYNYGGARAYGENFARLKPHVHGRTTYTPGDSFHPDFTERPGWLYHHDNVHFAADFAHKHHPYVEAQIHGGVDFASDVDSLHAQPGQDLYGLHDLISLGMQYKIPVYNHKVVPGGAHHPDPYHTFFTNELVYDPRSEEQRNKHDQDRSHINKQLDSLFKDIARKQEEAYERGDYEADHLNDLLTLGHQAQQKLNNQYKHAVTGHESFVKEARRQLGENILPTLDENGQVKPTPTPSDVPQSVKGKRKPKPKAKKPEAQGAGDVKKTKD